MGTSQASPWVLKVPRADHDFDLLLVGLLDSGLEGVVGWAISIHEVLGLQDKVVYDVLQLAEVVVDHVVEPVEAGSPRVGSSIGGDFHFSSMSLFLLVD